jgi:Flp pilus assembly pilin Flp
MGRRVLPPYALHPELPEATRSPDAAKEVKLTMLLSLTARIQSFWLGLHSHIEDESGAVATEYALLLTLIALAIIASATALGLAIAGKFSSACTTLGGAGC